MPAVGVFVDDEDDEYALLLSTRGELEFGYQAVIPIMEQSISIRETRPTLVALDYRLDEDAPAVEAAHRFKGSGLAQLLRDAAIASPETDFGIILVSGEMKLKELYAPDKTAHDLFDMVYSKEDVTRHRDRIRTEVLAISRAYEALRKTTVYDAFSVLSAHEDDRDRLETQEIATAFGQASAPHIIAKIVLRTFIERPGLLIDDREAAARLGLDEVSFEKLVGRLVDADLAYRGIFSSGWRRWWSHRLEAFAEGLIGQDPITLTSAQRAEALSTATGVDLKSAKSTWNGSDQEYVVFACACCRRPTEMRHSLAAFDVKIPRYSVRRRICWDCIQTDRNLEVPAVLVDETDEDLVDAIKNRPRNA